MASLIRRTLLRTCAPIFNSLSRMVPQVALASWAWQGPMRRRAASSRSAQDANHSREWARSLLERPIEGDWPYIDATHVKVREAGRIVSVDADHRRRPRHRWPPRDLGMAIGASLSLASAAVVPAG